MALLPVWGWGPTIGEGHMNPERAAEAAAMLKPRLAVPDPLGDLLSGRSAAGGAGAVRDARPAFEAAAARLAPDVPVRVLAPGESVRSRSLAVPIHWGTFYPAGLRRVVPAPFETPGLEFEAAAARLAPDVPVRVLAPGESAAIPAG